jgi:HEAT repeat protein
MTRYTLPTLLLLIVTLTAYAQPAPLDLKGKTLAAAFDELLPGMGSTDNGVRTNSQQRWQDICFALGAPGNEKQRVEACKLMAAKLDEKTPKEARLWLLQQLQRIGHEESLDALAAVLDEKDDEVRDMAVRALANNPSPMATENLIGALFKAKGKAKIGILNGLGHRGDTAAVERIAREFYGTDPETKIAAARALGRIPSAKLPGILLVAREREKDPVVHAAIVAAELACADRMLKIERTSVAVEIYKELNTPNESRAVRLAALRGLILAGGDKAGELVLTTLASDDPKARDVAIGQIESLSEAALTKLVEGTDKLPVSSRVAVITAIAARGNRAQVSVALSAAKSADPELKRAGILALGRLGDESTVEFLLDAMSSKDALAGTAAESLAAIHAEGVNEKLIAVFESEKNAARKIALIGIFEKRKATLAAPALLKATEDSDAGVRTASFAAMKGLASPAYFTMMVNALFKTPKNEREQAELAIVAVSTRLANLDKRADMVLIFIEQNKRDHMVDVLPLLGRFGGPRASGVISEYLSSKDAAAHEAAVTGLCNWPDASANIQLLVLAKNGETDAEKLRAIQALIRVNTVLIDRTNEEKLEILYTLKKTMELAKREQDRRAILEGLGNVRHIETLRYVVPYLDKPDYVQSACKGVVELAHSKMLREPNKAEFEKALDRVIAMCKDKGLVDRAKQYKEGR